MIVQIIGADGEVLGSRDVTGTQWTAGLDQFVNAEPLVVEIDTPGVPIGGWSVDRAGNSFFGGGRGRFDVQIDWVKKGDRIHIDAGKWVLDFKRR